MVVPVAVIAAKNVAATEAVGVYCVPLTRGGKMEIRDEPSLFSGPQLEVMVMKHNEVRHTARKIPLLGATGLVVMLLLFAAPIYDDVVVFSYPFEGSGGDQLSRGFYLSSYAGTNLGTVTLEYDATTAGTYVTSLTAELGAYGGPIIGSTQTLTTSVVSLGSGGETQVVYDFGGALVPTGSLVTFTQQVISGPGTLFYDVGASVGPAGITQTNGTNATLGHIPA